MKYSVVRIQKFITFMLVFHFMTLLYLVYTRQNKTMVFVVGGLSILIFLAQILMSEKRAPYSIFISTITLMALSTFTMILLGGNPLYKYYHISLPILLILYFRKEPVLTFGLGTAIFFLISYFMNDQVGIYPESYPINDVYFTVFLCILVSLIFLSIMNRLKTFIDVQVETVEAAPVVSNYLETSELSYIFYLKAIADNITITSDEVRKTAEKNIENIKREKVRLQNIMEIAMVMKKTFYEVKDSIVTTRGIIEQTLSASLKGDEKVSDIMSLVNRMIKFVDITKKSIYDLAAATKKVEGVVVIIDKIANQTRLLSLNASIEGARFEDRQAGFAMVSKEVKQLAALTHLSVQDITNTMRDIHGKTRLVQEIISREGHEALEGMDVARLGEQSIKYVVRMMESIQSEIVEISEELERNEDMARKITGNFSTIKSFIDENNERMGDLQDTSMDMRIQGEHLGKLIHANQVSEMYTRQNDKVYSLLTHFVMDYEKLIENEIRRGTIEESILFNREYNYISGEAEVRYRSKYDGFFETHIQSLIDEYLKLIPSGIYFVLMDNEGYIPLVNSTLIGTEKLIGDTPYISKPGVILQDYSTKHAQKSDLLYTLQCIQSLGEPIMDMSVQVHYKDRTWGVVRAGFQYT